MSAIISALIPVLLVILLGILLKRTLLPDQSQWAGFERIAYWVLIPAFLGVRVYSADLSAVPFPALALTLLAAILAMAVIVIACKWPLRTFGVGDAAFTSVFQTATRWNGFIALAVITPLYGNDGVTLIAVAMVAMIPLINVENVIALSLWGSRQPKNRLRLVVLVIRNPLVWSTLGALLLNLAGVPLPDPLLVALDIVGAGTLGATLLIVGAGLDLATVLRPSAAVILATILKLLVMPLLVFGFAQLFDLTGTPLRIAMIAGAVPTALNGYLVARQMGGDAPLYARIASIQTLVAFLTMPFILSLTVHPSG